MIFKSIMSTSCVCLAAVSFNVNAAVITDTNFTLTEGGFSDYELSAHRGISAGACCTSLNFSKENKFGPYNYLGGAYVDNYSTLSNLNQTVDVRTDYFIASDGARFTETAIEAGQFQHFSSNSDYIPGASIDVPFGTFYVGLAMGFAMDEGNPFSVFGWMQLSNSSTGLEMISSAMAYDEGGIIIGTTEVVPIPSAVWLFGSGLIGLFGMARRKSV